MNRESFEILFDPTGLRYSFVEYNGIQYVAIDTSTPSAKEYNKVLEGYGFTDWRYASDKMALALPGFNRKHALHRLIV